MNQTQRKFLIDKIKERVNSTIKILNETKKEIPELSLLLLHEVLSERFEIKSKKEIKNLILNKAKSTEGRKNWMGSNYGFSSSGKDEITFKASEIFIIPDKYKNQLKKVKDENKKIEQEIYKINSQANTLITRIQLASNKTLEKMIREVDDMGDISLMDEKLKLLQ